MSQALENLNIEDISQIGSISTDILLKEMLKEYIKAHLEIKTGRKIYETDGEYYICPITEQDRIDYVELHRQINGEGTLFLNPVCKDMMWENVLQGKDRVFSIFDKNAQYCGSIELQNPLSETPEIGIDLLENMRNKGIAPRVIRMFAKKTYEMQSVEYFIIRISSRNLHSKHVFEKMGVILICEEESLFTAFMKNFKEVVEEQDMSSIHDRLKVCSGEIENTEEEVVYRYKFTLDMF